MGTTAFVGYRFNGDVQGFEMSADGMYEQAGLRVLEKYKGLTKAELIEFFNNRVHLVDDTGLYSDELAIAPYEIWNLDWKNDAIEIVTSDDYTKNLLTREYGYVFDLDKDIIEVYEQADTEEEKNQMTHLITRDNVEEVVKIFEPKPREPHGLTDEELIEYQRRSINKDY